MPSSRNDPFPFRLIIRLSEKTTSAEVRGSPFAKWTFGFSLKVNTLALSDAPHDETSSGIGCARSALSYVKSVSKMPRSTIDPVGSYARCGSAVLSVNELSTTNVDPAARCELAASAAAAHTSAVSATSGTIRRHLRNVERLTV